MTEQQDGGEVDSDIPTAAEVKHQWKEHIDWLRKGDKSDRRLADLLAQCRKGNRCNLQECPKCELRKKMARLKVPAAVVKTIGSMHPISNIRVGAIVVDGKRRPLDNDKVRAIAASMELIGLQTPITVQQRGKKARLVTGGHRLAAAKKLGWKTIPSIVLLRDKIQTRIWQIVENLYRAELTALERAELTEELRQLVRQQQVGQVAPPGGVQPEDKGINKTAKVLGLTKEEIRRSEAIAAISPKAKAKVRKLGLDDNQRALLEIAKHPTPETQLRAIKEIVKQRRAARDRLASAPAVDKKTAAEIEALEADIREKEGNVDRLKGELAIDRKRLQDIHEKLAVQGEVAEMGPPSKEDDLKRAAAATRVPRSSDDRSPDVMHEVSVEDMVPAVEAERLRAELAAATERLRHVEHELETARAIASRPPAVDASMRPPTDGGIPPFLNRCPLSPDDQLAFDAIKAAWANSTTRAALLQASPVVQERFSTALRADIASSSSAAK